MSGSSQIAIPARMAWCWLIDRRDLKIRKASAEVIKFREKRYEERKKTRKNGDSICAKLMKVDHVDLP